jgi:protein-tyrosine-phosphatase
MSCCRGIIVASNSNRARTQMAEGFLRFLSRDRVHVTSGGVHHGTSILPQAVQVMDEWDVPINQQRPSTLAHVWEKIGSYDVFVSIDEDVGEKCSPEQAHFGVMRSDEEAKDVLDPMLFPPSPFHWSVGTDAADVKESWKVWSPRVPSIAHENSLRKFQDHLYEGEPLFRTLSSDAIRHRVRHQRRWVVPSLAHWRAMERSDGYLVRVREVRQQLLDECVQLLRDLECHYGEALMDESQWRRLAAKRCPGTAISSQ